MFTSDSKSEISESKGGLILSCAHFAEDGGFELGDALEAPQVADDAVGKFVVEERVWGKFGKELPTVRFVGTIRVTGDDIGLGSEAVLEGVTG